MASHYLPIVGNGGSQLFSNKAKEGGFILSRQVGGRGGERVVFHLLFADDSLLFYDACLEQLTYLTRSRAVDVFQLDLYMIWGNSRVEN